MKLIPANGLCMKGSAENRQFSFGSTQAKFLNFTYYFILGNSSNLKIWRLTKNARTISDYNASHYVLYTLLATVILFPI